MFVSSEQIRRNPEFNYLSIERAQGNNLRGRRLNRKATVQFPNCSDSPKGALAYKTIFPMSEKNNFVTDAVCITVTPQEAQLITLLRQNSTDLQAYLADALERATYLCEFQVSPEQLRGDYHLHFLLKAIQNVNTSTN